MNPSLVAQNLPSTLANASHRQHRPGKPDIPPYSAPGSQYSNQTTTTQTVVHFVASKNAIDIARKLFDNQPPASARVRDKRGQYALHRAAAVGSVPMVNLLIKNKSPLNATDSGGQTALHHAVAEGHGESGPGWEV